MLRKTLLILAGAALAAFAQDGPPPHGFHGGGPGPHMFGFEGSHQVVTGAPYSATAVTTTAQTLADGSHINRSNTTAIARDSAGRTRREQALGALGGAAGANSAKFVFIDDPVGQASYVLDPNQKVARKMVKPAARPANAEAAHERHGDFNASEKANVKKESLGTQMVAGVQAEGTRITHTIPVGRIGNDTPIQVVTENWYSPDLHIMVKSTSSDPRMGQTTYEVTNIQRAEPSAALFQVPSEYSVKTMEDHFRK